MGRFFFLPPPRRAWLRRDGGAMSLLLAMVFFGVLAGAASAMLLRSGAADGTDVSGLTAALPLTLPASVWRALRFFLLLFLLGTSWLGVMLLPAAALLRGAVLGYGVASLYAVYAYRGLLAAAVIFGFPALVLLPCFLTAAGDAFSASRALASMRFGVSAPADRSGALRHALLILPLIALDAVYGFYFAPMLLQRL